MWDGAEPSQGAEIVSFPSPLTLDSGLGKLTMAGIWDGAEPSPADMFRGRLGGGGGCSTTTSRNIDALCFFFLFGPVAVKVEEWKTRFSILHYLLGEVLVLQKKDKTTSRPHPEPDWTGLPVQSIRIMVMMRGRRTRVTKMMVLVDDGYVNDDGDDDDDQG